MVAPEEVSDQRLAREAAQSGAQAPSWLSEFTLSTPPRSTAVPTLADWADRMGSGRGLLHEGT